MLNPIFFFIQSDGQKIIHSIFPELNGMLRHEFVPLVDAIICRIVLLLHWPKLASLEETPAIISNEIKNGKFID